MIDFSQKKIEVLSPAGDMEKLKVAVAYGADAVYLSGKSFGLRAGSGNFTPDELQEAVTYAHQRGVLCYITVNIFAHPDDFLRLDEELLFYKEINADALIISDAGIFRRARKIIPDMEIHISTQASVTNADGCLLWYEMGARRIVLARELTLKEIKKIREAIPDDLQLECFIHGAMCMSYSGRCILSNYFTGRGANQGACAQSCRWKYYLSEEKRPDQPLELIEDDRGSYILNSKDMCMIDSIPELVEAGIDSFKIEGRIKGSFYTASVTWAYRQAVDRYMKNPDGYSTDKMWRQQLERTVHRTFGTGFYYDQPIENAQIFLEDTYLRPATVVGMITGYDEERKLLCVSQRNKLKEGDTLTVLCPDGVCTELTAEVILDENFEPIESTPHALMPFYIPSEKKFPPYSFLSLSL